MAKRKTNKEDVLVEGLAIAGFSGILAAIAYAASKEAYNRAKSTNIPLVIEEDNKLFKIYPNGRKILIKDLPRQNRNLPPHFTLK
jgi:hypothetical protein